MRRGVDRERYRVADLHETVLHQASGAAGAEVHELDRLGHAPARARHEATLELGGPSWVRAELGAGGIRQVLGEVR
jgi:hypothetical protein